MAEPAQTIDFRHSRWGHALHASTFCVATPLVTGHFWRKRKTPRAYVLVHSSTEPRIGDSILYLSSGRDVSAKIDDIEYMHDPADMYGLYLKDLHRV